MKNFRCFIARSFVATVILSIIYLQGAPTINAKEIRVSGFDSSRNIVPLQGFTPSGYFEEDPSLALRAALLDPTKFGENGRINCPVSFQSFVPSIQPGSLISNNKRKSDVFFGGLTNRDLTTGEANELANFIIGGGVVYMSAQGYSNHQGIGIPGYQGSRINPLFSALNILDTFPQNEVVDFYYCGKTTTPAISPVTHGPFGVIQPFYHSIFNPINTNGLQSIATGYNQLCFIGTLAANNANSEALLANSQYNRSILAEGKFGKGYLSVSGEPIYINTSYDTNLTNYFLNLFSLACTDEEAETTQEPFLDLPWNYSREGVNLIFRDAALSLNSYFDHEYPLLSSGLKETTGVNDNLISFKSSNRTDLKYSSHDGYDWGKKTGANLGAEVLAAAPGCATYSYNKASGNAIHIDHGNNYQTRYYHLLDNGLITKSISSCTQVARGQKIGLVGSTGNSTGAHIHFMVVEDKDQDNNFDDNIPDGITDPFGWSGNYPDPWPIYSFQYRDEDNDGNLDQRTGNKSNYLWLGDIRGFSGLFTKTEINEVVAGRYRYRFFENTFPTDVRVEEKAGASVQASDILFSIGSISILGAKESNGNLIETLLRPFSLTIDFGNFDLSPYKEDTISIYSSQDGNSWNKESTTIDFVNKKASSQINHLSEFALMAEKKDIISPATEAVFTGLSGKEDWYRSDVEVSLNAIDNTGGLGIDYTLFRLNDEDWQEYKEKLVFAGEGDYKIEFYSADKSENIEEVKTRTFSIDKTPPEADIKFDISRSRFKFTSSSENEVVEKGGYGKKHDTVSIIDKAGNKLSLFGKLLDTSKVNMMDLEALQYNLEEKVFLEKNNFFVLHQAKSSIELTQRVVFKDQERITIAYNNVTNESTIIDKLPKPFTEETRLGIVFLSLVTKNGKLEVVYE